MTEFELPNISVDVVPVTLNPFSGKLEVIVGRRIYEPNLGEFALPGVLLTPHERLDEAAFRALEKKLSISQYHVTELIDLGTFDNPDRDPRGATVSIAKLAVISAFPEGMSAAGVTSVPIEEIANESFLLPFDHNSIVLAASNLLAEKMLFNKAITKAILGNTFTTKTLRNVLVQLQETDNGENIIFDASNLTRQLKGTGWVEMVEDKETITSLTFSTSRGRPSRVWTWL